MLTAAAQATTILATNIVDLLLNGPGEIAGFVLCVCVDIAIAHWRSKRPDRSASDDDGFSFVDFFFGGDGD
jgi:hypothetical protein